MNSVDIELWRHWTLQILNSVRMNSADNELFGVDLCVEQSSTRQNQRWNGQKRSAKHQKQRANRPKQSAKASIMNSVYQGSTKQMSGHQRPKSTDPRVPESKATDLRASDFKATDHKVLFSNQQSSKIQRRQPFWKSVERQRLWKPVYLLGSLYCFVSIHYRSKQLRCLDLLSAAPRVLLTRSPAHLRKLQKLAS